MFGFNYISRSKVIQQILKKCNLKLLIYRQNLAFHNLSSFRNYNTSFETKFPEFDCAFSITTTEFSVLPTSDLYKYVYIVCVR